MTALVISGALDAPRLLPGPKRIYFACDPIGAAAIPSPLPLGPRYRLTARAALSLARLLLIIETDCDPAALEPYYRASTVGDALLRGPWRVMHLHLIDAGSDDIVYLVQRDDGSVIVVEISDHRHLQTIPRGANLRQDRARAAARRADRAGLLTRSSPGRDD